MIQVSEEQIRQIEYLIEQSIMGNHVLFDVARIREVFVGRGGRPDETSPTQAQAIENHIEKMIGLPTLIQKRAYLERLDNRTYRMIVRTYFNIVENNLYDHGEAAH